LPEPKTVDARTRALQAPESEPSEATSRDG